MLHQLYTLIVIQRGGILFNPFKKNAAEITGKAKERKEKQEERRQRAQARGERAIK
jgi:hypothetical protein